MLFHFHSKKPAKKFIGLCLILAGSSSAFAVDSPDTVSVIDQVAHPNAFVFSMITSVRETAGKFDQIGNYTAFTDGSSVWGVADIFSASYRINAHWDAGLSFSASDSNGTYPSGSTTAQSIGNPLFDGRYHTPIFNNWAHLTLHAGMSLPINAMNMQITGDPSKDNLSNNSAGGDGTASGFSGRLGAGLTHTFRALHLRAAFDTTFIYPFATQGVDQYAPAGTPSVWSQKGPEFMLGEGLSYEINSKWTINGGLKQLWGADSWYGGVLEDNTACRSFSTAIGASYLPNSTWRWTVSYDTQFPFYAYLVNMPYSPAVSLIVSYSGL